MRTSALRDRQKSPGGLSHSHGHSHGVCTHLSQFPGAETAAGRWVTSWGLTLILLCAKILERWSPDEQHLETHENTNS